MGARCLKLFVIKRLTEHQEIIAANGDILARQGFAPGFARPAVECPVCGSEYRIVAAAGGPGRGADARPRWPRWQDTDAALVARHGRHLLLIAPLAVAAAVAWWRLRAYRLDVARVGHGPMLTAADAEVAVPFTSIGP